MARPRLLRRLDEGSAGPVTLVAAPAGWGKTTLLASWVRLGGAPPDVEPGAIVPDSGDLSVSSADRPVSAWMSVEAGDDSDRLWAYLAAALRSATGSAESGPVPDRPPRPDQLEALAATLAAADRPVLLILDDLHRVADPAALTGLEFLLRHAGRRLRLVIGARAGLHLPLHRLRLAGELTEIGPDELAFTDDEVADLLTAHAAALPATAVHRLRERTGGWPAALRIAALAVRGRPDPERWVGQFGGDQPEIAGYLHEEVLATLDPAQQDLLRRTALVDTVCADLAEALTGRADAGQALADLAGTGGLLHREDTRPPWYRCESLLADLLRADLARLPADELRELHVRAAEWYAGAGRPADGLRHALAAGRWDLAGDLFVAHWPELTRYDSDPVHVPAPASPPAEVIRADPEVALAGAAERAYAGDLPAATGHLRAAAGHAAGLPVPRRDRFLRLVTALELTVARLADDRAEVRAAAARLLRTRPAEATPTRVPDSPPAGAASSAPRPVAAARPTTWTCGRSPAPRWGLSSWPTARCPPPGSSGPGRRLGRPADRVPSWSPPAAPRCCSRCAGSCGRPSRRPGTCWACRPVGAGPVGSTAATRTWLSPWWHCCATSRRRPRRTSPSLSPRSTRRAGPATPRLVTTGWEPVSRWRRRWPRCAGLSCAVTPATRRPASACSSGPGRRWPTDRPPPG